MINEKKRGIFLSVFAAYSNYAAGQFPSQTFVSFDGFWCSCVVARVLNKHLSKASAILIGLIRCIVLPYYCQH